MNAVLDDTFVSLIDGLCALDDKTNGQPRMAEANRPQALAGLERILLDLPALNEHIRRLQIRLGRSFRHQALLPEEQTEQIVSQGLAVLSNDELAGVLLNPIALRDLAFRIGEDLPDCWLERMSEVGRETTQAEGIARKPRKVVLPAPKEKLKPALCNGSESFQASVRGTTARTLTASESESPTEIGISIRVGRRSRSRSTVSSTASLTPGFWRRCPEFRDCGPPVIRDWLQRHRTLDWPRRNPPRFELVPLGGGQFRLVS